MVVVKTADSRIHIVIAKRPGRRCSAQARSTGTLAERNPGKEDSCVLICAPAPTCASLTLLLVIHTDKSILPLILHETQKYDVIYSACSVLGPEPDFSCTA